MPLAFRSARVALALAVALTLSAAAHARRLARSLQDEVDLARRAAEMRTGDAAERVGAFTARLAAVAVRRRESGIGGHGNVGLNADTLPIAARDRGHGTSDGEAQFDLLSERHNCARVSPTAGDLADDCGST